MARAYLGKISALVTANTSDFQAKLNASAKDVRSFAATMQSSLSRAQSSGVSSLRDIYTEAQKVDRALKAAASQRLRFTGFDAKNIEQASSQLQRLFSATELINKPLVNARRTFDNLSSDVQAAFLPALVRAQQQVELLNRAIQGGQAPSEAAFEAVRRRVDLTTQALFRLTEAQEKVGGLATGSELRFQNPGFVSELERAARLQTQVSQLQPQAIQGGGFSQLIASQRAAAEEVLRLQSNIERASLLPGADTRGLVSQQAAALQAFRATNEEIERQIFLEQQAGASSSIAGRGGFTNVLEGRTRDAENRLRPADSAQLTRRVEAEFLSLQARVEQLPAAIRGGLTPALDEARTRVAALAGGFSATSDQIESASSDVQRLAADVARAQSAVRAFGTSFEQIFRDATLRQAEAELSVLARTLARVGAVAAGPAQGAFESLRTRLLQAASDGTIGLERVQNELRQLRQEAIAATAAVSGISVNALNRRVSSAGDVARGSFGNAGLAVQQLVFAVDDFFSVTGDLDQRIRAVGNNVSQFGFIVGGTYGLIAGVAVSITGQLVAALVKWYRQGASTESQVKALNDLLSREKTLVEELASAFGRLADAVGDIRVDEQTDALRRQRQELDEIRKKQEEINNARIFAVDQDVQRERALQVDLQQQLEKSANPAERITLSRRIAESQDRQREAEQRALARPVAKAGEVAQDIASSRLAVRLAQIEADVAAEAARAGAEGRPFVDNFSAQATEQAQSDFETQRAQLEEDLDAAGNAAEQAAEAIRLLDEELRRLQDERAGRFFLEDPRVNIERERQIQSLELRRRELERQQFNAPRDEAMRSAGAAAAQGARSLQQAFDFVAEATRGGGSVIRNALSELQRERDDAVTRLKQAASLQGEAGLAAAQQAAKEIQAINDRIAAELSAAESVAAFARALDRASASLARTVAEESRQIADQSRRDANAARARADLGLEPGGDAAFRRRQASRAEAAAQADADRALSFRQDAERARLDFEAKARAGQLGNDVQDEVRARDEAALRAQRAREAGDAEGELLARQEQERRQRNIDRAFDNDPETQRRRAQADEFDREAARRRERERSIERGRELSLSPAEQAARELGRGLRDLLAAAQEEAGGAMLPADAQRQLGQRQSNLVRAAIDSSAPAISALAESVRNAVIQGPSRAGIEAVDIRTQEGARELNRLLREDDAAKNADFVELQRQSELLTSILEEAKKQNVPQVVD